MSSSRLKMNADKTQLIWLGAKQQLDKLSTSELDLYCRPGSDFQQWYPTLVFWSTAS